MTAAALKDPSLFSERMFIGEEWCAAVSGADLEVVDPSTGASLGSVPDAKGEDAAQAIAAAAAATGSWRSTTAALRAKLLERWHDLIPANQDDLACLLTAEQGKPLNEARGEIAYAASFVKWFAEEARRVGGKGIASSDPNRRILISKEPVGVSVAITPWNFPAAMITRKCAPALAAGCCVIIKPSDLTPFTALALAKLAERAGFPSGVLNVITGMPEEIGQVLTASPEVRKLSFTGSTNVGRILMRQCADTIKRLSLELGGNAPLIVFDDANIDVAIESTLISKFRNAGQTCVCANRIFVQDGIFDRFAEKLAARVLPMRVGDGRADGTDIGPLINGPAVQKVMQHLDDALANGASVFAQAENQMDPARFVAPTVLTGANSRMLLSSQETFGPLAPLFRFHHEDEAIELANDTPFGLASYFYTENLGRAFRVAERLEAGMVALNTGAISMEVAPFGGVKASGLGREGGECGIDEFLETKAFHVGGLSF